MTNDFELDLEKPLALGDAIYDELLEAILTGRIPPGTTLVQHELAKRLGVSRTPVRDALDRLARDGLVMRSTTGRIYVSTLSLQELREQYQVRQALESLATRLMAERATAQDLETLGAILERMRQAVHDQDAKLVTEYGSQFHAVITQASGNEYLKQLLSDLNNFIQRYRYAAVDIPGRIDDSVKEHERIYMALQAGDGDEAANFMRQHILESQHQLERALRDSRLLASDGSE